MPSLLHENFTFRGSLGEEKQGHTGLTEYMNTIHKSLSHYRCIIEELVSEKNKVFAKMFFTGIHQGRFMGYAPTQQQLIWNGCALFTFNNKRIADL